MILMMVIPFKRSFSEKLPHPFLTQYDGSSRVALRRCLLSLCLLHLFAGGGSLIHARRGGGLGGLGRAGYVMPPEQAPRLIQAAPRKRSHLPRFSKPRMLREQDIMFRESGLPKRSAWHPILTKNSHCGVAAHGRTCKFSPKLDAFYVPGGIVSGRPRP